MPLILPWRGGTPGPVDPDPPDPPPLSGRELLMMDGRFYGSDISTHDGMANTKTAYGEPTGQRFMAEMTGEIFELRAAIRGGDGYGAPGGGDFGWQIRQNIPGQMIPPGPLSWLGPGDPYFLGRTNIITNILGSAPFINPVWAFTSPIPVVKGRLYWGIGHQMKVGSFVSTNSVNVRVPYFPNGESYPGPYWGNSMHHSRASLPVPSKPQIRAWGNEDNAGEWKRHQLLWIHHYRLPSGQEIWSGIGSHSGNSTRGFDPKQQDGSMRQFNDDKPVRMSFTLRQLPTFRTRKLYLRCWREFTDPEPGPLRVTFRRGSEILSQFTVPKDRFPRTTASWEAPVHPTHGAVVPSPFIEIAMPEEITLLYNQAHTVEFGAAGSGVYRTCANLITEYRNRNSWNDGDAQYSQNGGASWSTGWHMGGPDALSTPTNNRGMILNWCQEVIQ